MMDVLEFLQKHWGILMTVAGAVWAVMKLSMDSKYPKRAELDAVRQNIGNVAQRVSKIEDKIEFLPTREDMANLTVLITEIKGDTNTTNARLSTLSHQVNLLIEEKIKG